ncbi:MAG: helix-turn-helix domain-containing protein [Bacteroidota bacterium]
MKVRNLKPNDNIAEYVERILVIENDQIATPFSLPLFANGSPTLLFKSTKGTIRDRATTNLTLFGQTILPETITFTEDFTLIAYFFKPYSLRAIFGVTAQELTDKPVDLNLLSAQKTNLLQEQLLNAGPVENRIALLDKYVSNLIAHSNNNNPIIQYATTQIAHNPSKEILLSVQKELHVTERTFQRMFENNIGIAPNLYRRICQFNAAFQQLNNRNYTKLSDIAFENGYADQSHYIRAFREFTNLTPKDYLNFGSAS